MYLPNHNKFYADGNALHSPKFLTAFHPQQVHVYLGLGAGRAANC